MPRMACSPNSPNRAPDKQKILDAVNVALANTHIASSHAAPIVVASLQVPDDLCLMQRFNDVYRLTAACVCSPVVLAPRRDRPHARRYSRSGADAQRQALNEDGAVLHAITRGGDLRASQLADAHHPGAVSTRIRGLGRCDIRQRSTTGSAFRATDLAPPRFRFGDVHDTRDLPPPRRNSELPRSRARPVRRRSTTWMPLSAPQKVTRTSHRQSRTTSAPSSKDAP